MKNPYLFRIARAHLPNIHLITDIERKFFALSQGCAEHSYPADIVDDIDQLPIDIGGRLFTAAIGALFGVNAKRCSLEDITAPLSARAGS